MNHLYLVRHGENPANLTKEFSFRSVDYSLTPKGRMQALQTGQFFRQKRIDAVYSSPLKRAAETAEIICAEVGLPFTVLEDLREVNVGALEGQKPTAELWEQHDAILKAWKNGQSDVSFADGEDHLSLCRRMRCALQTMTSDRVDANILAVVHGGLLALTLKDLCPAADWGEILNRPNSNCSITEYEVENGPEGLHCRLLAWASTSHLHGEAAILEPGTPRPNSFQE